MLDVVERAAPAASAPGRLAWRPPRREARPAPPVSDMAGFSRWLRGAGILETDGAWAPGGFVVLPWGVEILARFGALVREEAAALGFGEHEFPILAPDAVYAASEGLIDTARELIRTDPAGHGARHVLSPTGEQAIYTHWARHLRTASDFPRRLFQRGRYFRPATGHRLTGGGVYKCVEAGDVFEFHATHVDRAGSEADAEALAAAFTRLAARMGVAAVWSTRPPWTNRGTLYEWARAGDVPLPHGVTVQCAASYHQGQVFSRRYGVGIGAGADRRIAWQADGFISRRMVFAALHQRAGEAGPFCLPPDLAPVEAVILSTALSDGERDMLARLPGRLAASGLRVRWQDHGGDLRDASAHWRRRGVPLLVLVFGAGGAHGRARIVLCRGDDGSEHPAGCVTELVTLLPPALDDVRDACARARAARLSRHLAAASDEPALAAGLRQGRIVRCALDATADNVRRVAALRSGEVLGFAPSPSPEPCLYGGAPTLTHAFVSRRL